VLEVVCASGYLSRSLYFGLLPAQTGFNKDIRVRERKLKDEGRADI